MCWAVILFGPSGDVNSAAADQNHHHLPVIRQFATQLPWPDIRDYESATAPLWHIVLAIPARFGASDVSLRLLTALAGGILVLVVAMGARRFSLGQATALMALPASQPSMRAATATCPRWGRIAWIWRLRGDKRQLKAS